MQLLSLLNLALFIVGLSSRASALLKDGRAHGNMNRQAAMPKIPAPDPSIPVVSKNGTELPPYDTVYIFNQLIDHNNPELGTFEQRFWHTYENYEPGGPVIFTTPGEVNADGYTAYLNNLTINGLLAAQQNGTTVFFEHRFYGQSNPYNNLSSESFRVHTIQQAIDDIEYFAKNVHLPMPNGDQMTPDRVPWVMMGGSYAGALTSWTMTNKPGLFAAGYASSAVVEAIGDFWRFFVPIQENMPRNCSADVQKTIQHIDTVLMGENQTAIQEVKNIFGLTNVTHLDDVAGSLRNNLWDWQSLSVTSGPNTTFTRFCDALEVKNGQVSGPDGWGVDHALPAWGKFWTDGYLSHLCGANDIETCFETHDGTEDYFTNIEVDNENRSWQWIVCNEVGFLQESAPEGQPTLVSRLIQPAYELRQCQLMFPDAFPQPPNLDAGIAQTNSKYEGWSVNTANIFFANGQRDPWREATVSAETLSQADLKISQSAIGLSDGFHCTDLSTKAGTVSTLVKAVQDKGLAQLGKWLSTWKPRGNGHTNQPKPAPHQPSKKAAAAVDVKPVNAWFTGIKASEANA
ncbi:serine carboxypeptidase S28-domain-containing protein [Crepidotus variabilis]|uniref:Serine carboxypeptidase S28-domain-containing protein n=1 Tax=Crepidotus variabilis TaxID=179855 RepID=A0A9P6ETS2_9AGAR|nr:serine carboxypeptidase S28-domain-containing protein [Crepidotus variabilis]